MRRAKLNVDRNFDLNFDRLHWANLPRLAATGAVLTWCLCAGLMAQQPGQKTFSSAEDASQALVAAARIE